jgi:hypothetical protein
MRGQGWRVAAVSVVTGLTLGSAGLARAAVDEETAAIVMLDDGPVRSDQLLRVEWMASSGGPGRTRLEGSVHNGFGRAARNVQLRVTEIGAAGEPVSTVIGPTLESVPGRGRAHFTIPVPANRHTYQLAVASFSFDFAEPAGR